MITILNSSTIPHYSIPTTITIRPIIINQGLDDFTQILNIFHDLLPGIDINQVLMEITKQERKQAY